MTVYRDQKVWLAGYNLTGKTNSMALECRLNANDVTVFGDTARVNGAGLFENTASVSGFYDATYDAGIHGKLAVTDQPFSFSSSGAAGAVAYSYKAMLANYTPLQGSVGDEHGYSADAVGSGKLVRGTLIYNSTSVGTTGNSSGFQLGAVTSTQKVYAILHVTRVSGTDPTLDVVIESDNGSGFGTPLERITFTQMTAIGSQWIELSGAITDDYWRTEHTIGGTSPQFDFAVILAIV
jgi:hypothetical protein